MIVAAAIAFDVAAYRRATAHLNAIHHHVHHLVSWHKQACSVRRPRFVWPVNGHSQLSILVEVCAPVLHAIVPNLRFLRCSIRRPSVRLPTPIYCPLRRLNYARYRPSSANVCIRSVTSICTGWWSICCPPTWLHMQLATLQFCPLDSVACASGTAYGGKCSWNQEQLKVT